MKYFISSLGFWSKNATSILNKNILLLKKKILKKRNNWIEYTYKYAPTSTHIHLYIYTHTYACMHTYTYTYIQCIHIYISIFFLIFANSLLLIILEFLHLAYLKIQQILKKPNIENFVTLKHIVFGYKIFDKDYFDFNYFLTILGFSIYKAYYVFEQKTKQVK
jgi:hypothetical protein